VRFTNTNSRNQLRERQRRDRATALTLRNAYPQFVSLRIEFDFSEPETSAPAPHVLVLHPPSQAYFVFPCPYADCDGEFDLTSAVAALSRSGDASCEGHQQCGGQRVRDHRGRLPCGLTLEYFVSPELALQQAGG
jgi:hypothetical protein